MFITIRSDSNANLDHLRSVHNITKKADEKYILPFIRFLKYVNLLTAASYFIDTIGMTSTFKFGCHKS